LSRRTDIPRRIEELRGPPPPRHEASQPRRQADPAKLRQDLSRRGHALPPPAVYRRDPPRPDPPARQSDAPSGPPLILEEATGGREVLAPGGGKALLICRRLADQADGGQELCEGLTDALREGTHLRRRLSRICRTPVDPKDILFLDLETTGLSCSPLFLAGLMLWEDGALVIRQYFARHYAEERAVILLLREAAAGRTLLVSFNGKSFDVPFVRARAAANGVHCPLAPAHLDLLHECRREYRPSVPNCRLTTLEQHVCGRARGPDIPGYAIPDAYHAFVRTGDAGEMVEVVRHNRLDLITLADLMARLGRPAE